MYHLLSVEDDESQEETLRGHVERYARETGTELALDWRRSAFDLSELGGRYDLVFLDIDLPGISGMDAARELRRTDDGTQIVFVTNLAQYALRGYEVDALDFVVKPVAYYDFRLRMDRAVSTLARMGRRSVSVPTQGGVRVLLAGDVVAVDVRNHDVNYHLTDGSTFTTRLTLKEAEAGLAGSTFVRVSHACLANMAHIDSIDGDCLHMSDGEELYFSRARKREGMAIIARYLNGSL